MERQQDQHSKWQKIHIYCGENGNEEGKTNEVNQQKWNQDDGLNKREKIIFASIILVFLVIFSIMVIPAIAAAKAKETKISQKLVVEYPENVLKEYGEIHATGVSNDVTKSTSNKKKSKSTTKKEHTRAASSTQKIKKLSEEKSNSVIIATQSETSVMYANDSVEEVTLAENESVTESVSNSQTAETTSDNTSTVQVVEPQTEQIADSESVEEEPQEEVKTTSELDAVEVEWNFDYTEEDVQLLGDLMYAEEGVLLVRQSYEDAKRAHMLAGSVVLHRLADGRWGDSIRDVIFDGIGYAQTTRDRIGNIETPEEVYEWAEELLKNGPRGPRTLVFQAQFKQGVEVYAHIDNQYFCLMAENA